MKRILLTALFCLVTFVIGPVLSYAQSALRPAPDATLPVVIGRFTARFERGGLFLDVDDIPLLKGGIVQVFAKDYSQGYYGSGSHPPDARVETLSDGGRAYTALFAYKGEGIAFEGTQRTEVHPDGRVTFTLRARWDGQKPVLLEWNPIRLWAYPLVGGTYQADITPGDPVNGRIGLKPLGPSYPVNRLAPPWQRLSLHLPALGELNFTAPDSANGLDLPVAFDAREDPYLQSDRLFWMGYLGTDLLPGQETVRTLTLDITPASSRPSVPSLQPSQEKPIFLPAQVHHIPDARRVTTPPQDMTGHPLLIPRPKRIRFTDAKFPFAGRIPVTMELPESEAGRNVRTAFHALTNDLRRDTGASFVPHTGRWNGYGIYVSVEGVGASETGESLRAPTQAEGYALRVGPESVVIVGRDAAGAFYGLQTLRQLLTVSVPTAGIKRASFAFAGAEITDWPSLAFRGAHLFVGRNALPFHTRLIEQVFSRYKMNALVLECEYTRWKSHPEVAVPYSMDPDDLRAEVAFARAHFMEPIPLVNSLGHSEWIFKNGQHLNLAEDVSSPHAYDASNPDTYRFIFDIYQEVLDIFHPRLFHIGHDEVKIPANDQFGKYPARPQNIQKGVTPLFIEDTNRLADWLRERGVRTMLWSDMLLHRSEGPTLPHAPEMTAANAPKLEEARRLRSLLPKDALIADWRYEPGSEQRNGLQIFQDAGHETLGSAWFQPENIRGWASQALQAGALGTLQTTWAGYDSNAGLLETEYKQFHAFVLAAEYAWNGGKAAAEEQSGGAIVQKPPDALPYRAAEAFARAYRSEALQAQPRAGWYLSLRHAANINLFGRRSDTLPWAAYPPLATDEIADTTDTFLEPGSFPQVADIGLRVVGPHLGGLMLRGLLNPPQLPLFYGEEVPVSYPGSVSLPIHAKARELAFLHATGYAVETGTKAAAYRLIYADGKTVEIPLRYGYEIRALDDAAETGYSAIGLPWDNGNPLTLRLFRWTNPHPEATIARLEFRAESPYAAPILFSLTGYTTMR